MEKLSELSPINEFFSNFLLTHFLISVVSLCFFFIIIIGLANIQHLMIQRNQVALFKLVHLFFNECYLKFFLTIVFDASFKYYYYNNQLFIIGMLIKKGRHNT